MSESETKPAETNTTPESETKPAETKTMSESEDKPAETKTVSESEAKPAETENMSQSEAKPAETKTMPESDAKPAETVTVPPPVEEDGKSSLKYLEFVQVAAIYAIVCFSTLYEYAKENSGSLKPGVQTVEETVKTVIGPVYEKFHNVPFDLLKFADRKVDESVNELDRHVPSLVKSATKQILLAAQEVALEVHRAGLVDGAANLAKSLYTNYEPTTKDLYTRYGPVAEQYAMLAWITLNRLPLFPQVAHIAVPTAAYWAERYNQAVAYAAERGYSASSYLPLVPIDKIAKAFDNASYGQSSVYTRGESITIKQ